MPSDSAVVKTYVIGQFTGGGGGGGGTPYDNTPSMDGIGSSGSSTKYARGDHRHPSDSRKADISALAQKANTSDVPASASINNSGLISFKSSTNVTLFTLQLPIYTGEVI